MRVAVLGRTHWLLDAAHRLLEAGHEIALVASAPAASEYRVDAQAFRELAETSCCQYHDAPDVNSDSFIEELRAAKIDVGVSVNWPSIIQSTMCNATKFGILNGHGGDLPRYRGNACANWAILRNEQVVGLCIHFMEPGSVDSGDVVVRHRMRLDNDTYIADVYSWYDEMIPQAFVEALAKLSDPNFTAENQSELGIRPLRCHPRRLSDAAIDWRQDADAIARLVRASSRPFAGAFARLEDGKRVTIWRARSIEKPDEIAAVPGQIIGRGERGTVVACGTGVLEIEEFETADATDLVANNKWRFDIVTPTD